MTWVADVARAVRDRAVRLLREQPVRVATAIAAVVVVVFPGVVDEEQLAEILAKVAALVAAFEVVRRYVFSPETVDRMTRRARRG